MNLKITLDDIDFEIEYNYSRYYPATRHSPEEPADFEITEVRYTEYNILVPEYFWNKIYEKHEWEISDAILQDVRDRQEYEAEARAEIEFERRREEGLI